MNYPCPSDCGDVLRAGLILNYGFISPLQFYIPTWHKGLLHEQLHGTELSTTHRSTERIGIFFFILLIVSPVLLSLTSFSIYINKINFFISLFRNSRTNKYDSLIIFICSRIFPFLYQCKFENDQLTTKLVFP